MTDTTTKAAWRVVGEDGFSGDEYPVSEHATEAEALEAAHAYLRDVERTQPSSSSGGQSGIQDRVYVVSPDGMFRPITPS
jgi:hypothetical protein